MTRHHLPYRTVFAAILIAAPAWTQTGAYREAPAELTGVAARHVGELVADVQLETLSGETVSLREVAGDNGLVIALRSADCPVSRRYGRELARIEREYASRGFGFLFVNASAQDTPEAARADKERFGLQGPYVLDASKTTLAARLAAVTTTEVFLLDRAGTLRYRGAIDDQYGIGYSRPEATATYLRNALESVAVNEPVALEAVSAPGCVLGIEPVATDAALTYHGRVSRILQRNCESCHRDGGAGPFPLSSYESARGFASMIAYVVEREVMPPWFASADTGHWANDRSLSESDRTDLLAWVESGAPEGDPADAPLPRAWVAGWSIGEPDAVVEIPEAIDVPAEGVVDYYYEYVKTDFPEDRWVQKMEILPTAPQVTHHVLVFLEEPGRKGLRDRRRAPDEPAFQGGLGGYFASTVPGQQPTVYEPGMAKRLPKGAWLKFQIHYTPNGEATRDRTRIGFVFADAPPRREVETAAATTVRFEIPPGAPSHEVAASYRFEEDGVLLSFFPHMHLRGKAFRYELVAPDGETTTLLDVPRYDFNWQLHYRFRDPLEISAGSVIRATGWFDNSADNPANPDPSRTVGFGEQSFDEMMIGYFDWYRSVGTATADTAP